MRAAIHNSGLIYPRGHLTVNLAPADLRKEGPAYDLPIAVALLIVSGQVRPTWILSSSSASSRWMAPCATSMASCPWLTWPRNKATKAFSCPKPMQLRRRW